MQTQSASETLQERVPAVITGLPPDQHVRMLEDKSFSFQHSLGNYPAMSIPNIQKLTRQLLDAKRYDQVYCRVLSDGKMNAIDTDAVLATLQSFDTAGAWLRLTRVDEINDEFRELSETFYADLSLLLDRDIKSQVFKTFVTLFISSPGAVTHYHMDHTWNFLLQIGGRKTVHLFDQNDPRILQPKDMDAWYWNRFAPTLRDDVEGIAYDLTPGTGVHHPVHAPHWVQNGPEISVSLSFGLCLHATNDLAKIHQINFLLRKLGLTPTPPHQSPLRDKVKIGAVNLISNRNGTSFDDVVYSGQHRMEKALKMARIIH